MALFKRRTDRTKEDTEPFPFHVTNPFIGLDTYTPLTEREKYWVEQLEQAAQILREQDKEIANLRKDNSRKTKFIFKTRERLIEWQSFLEAIVDKEGGTNEL